MRKIILSMIMALSLQAGIYDNGAANVKTIVKSSVKISPDHKVVTWCQGGYTFMTTYNYKWDRASATTIQVIGSTICN